jgi:hypothetical protein
MAKTLEKEVVAAIERAILEAQRTGRNPDLHSMAARFNCTYQSVCYIRRRIEKLQRTGVDDRKKAGRKPLPEQDKIAEAVKGLLACRPELDQRAICDYIFDEFGVKTCQATVSRMLKRNAIPHKVSNCLYKKSKLFTVKGGGSATGETTTVAHSLLAESCETHKISPHDSVNLSAENASISKLLLSLSAKTNFHDGTIKGDSAFNCPSGGIESTTAYRSPYT